MRSLLLAAALPFAPLGLGGCPPSSPCGRDFVGSQSQPITIAPFALDANGAVRELHDGDSVTLASPPQGGRVLYVGARLANVDPCNVEVSAELQDPVTGNATSGRDTRTANFEPSPTAGLVQPTDLTGLQNVPNVPACPDALGAGVDGREELLVFSVTDRLGRTAKAHVRVKTVCGAVAGDPDCPCICGPDYHPGKCLADGGIAGDDAAATDGATGGTSALDGDFDAALDR